MVHGYFIEMRNEEKGRNFNSFWEKPFQKINVRLCLILSDIKFTGWNVHISGRSKEEMKAYRGFLRAWNPNRFFFSKKCQKLAFNKTISLLISGTKMSRDLPHKPIY